MSTNEAECLAAIAAGKSAYELLTDAIPGIDRKFERVDSAIVRLLSEVRKKFPDAQYYTASGGFNLLLGNPHNARLSGQQELIALSGRASIGDGDF